MSVTDLIMKKNLTMLFVGLMATANICAQIPDSFLDDDARPNGINWLPTPPETTDGAFYNDFFYYQWGKTVREGETGDLALWYEGAALYLVFGDCLDITLDPETTPEIIKLAEKAVTDAKRANTNVKDYYQRKRPFATFNEPSLKPETDEQEALTYSYPSGHSSRGWMFALALATVAPECTEALMLRAREFAMSRVICGHHWKSDIDASLMLTAGIFANVVVSEAYQQQLVKAREEYQQVKETATGVRQAQIVTHPAAAGHAYTTDGLPATDSSRGIIIQDGLKKMAK